MSETDRVEQKYGDEFLDYNILVRDMTPEQARDYIEANSKDGLIERMPPERYSALRIRTKKLEG